MTREEFEEVKRVCQELGIKVEQHQWTRDEEFREWCLYRMIQQKKVPVLHCLMPLNL